MFERCMGVITEASRTLSAAAERNRQACTHPIELCSHVDTLMTIAAQCPVPHLQGQTHTEAQRLPEKAVVSPPSPPSWSQHQTLPVPSPMALAEVPLNHKEISLKATWICQICIGKKGKACKFEDGANIVICKDYFGVS